jgi:predicted  nucleic acid-binding Zn-ribbon protein
MSIVANVLEKLRGKRQEQLKTVYQQYHEMVVALSADQQVDIDELAIAMDQLDRSDTELEADIQNIRKRRELAESLAERQSVEKSLPALETALDKAKQELQAAIDKLQPAVDRAFDDWRQANLRLDQLSHCESELIHSCQDPEILSEEAAIEAERQPLVAKLRELRENQRTGNLPVELEQKLADLARRQQALNIRKLVP